MRSAAPQEVAVSRRITLVRGKKSSVEPGMPIKRLGKGGGEDKHINEPGNEAKLAKYISLGIMGDDDVKGKD